jgi:hypothetical protein
MKIKVTVPNSNYTRTQWVIDREVDFFRGVATFEGDERHVAVLKGQKGYEVEVIEDKKSTKKAAPKKKEKE